MCRKNVLTIVAVAMLALATGQVQAETVTVPNGEFLIYKPGTNYTVTATFPAGNIWANGVGDNCPVNGGSANYSDGTNGTSIDCPGWKGLTGTNDLLNNGVDDSVGYNAFGTWSGGTGTTAESADSLGDIAGGSIYTLSAMVNGSGGPLVLDLLAGGVALAPSSSITPTLPTDGWQEISRTYDTGAVGEYAGQPMTIVLGTGAEDLVGTRVRFDNVSLSYEPLNQAANLIPADKATDVCRNLVLSWTPGMYADKHDVYFGTNFDDVNDATITNQLGVLKSQDQIEAYYPATGTLDLVLGQTYYWRIDEVNAPPDSTIFKGFVWSFTTEPVGYPIENVTATASSSNSADEGPENTINGSGLADDLHSVENKDMWRSSSVDPNAAWIQYEFDKVYKLYQMWVWNHNSSFEPVVGFGIKEATVEYSVDGANWAILGTTQEFAQGPGSAGYAANTTIDFSGVPAKYVRLTVSSNWGGIVPQYGLSEVRFLYIPVFAREPSPDSGATDVDVDVTLSWKAGREAAEHNVYIGTDEQTVIDSNVPVSIVTDAQDGPISLDLGETYYWKVNEVNMAETPTMLEGDIWNFTARDFLVVEDFESYNDIEPPDPESNRIYETWIDGFDNPSTNGSTIGYIEPFQPSMETSIVYADGKQSVPLFYNNTVAVYSEVSVNTDALAIGRNWTKGSPTTMMLRFYGDPNNAVTEQLYVKIGGTRVDYPGDPAELAKPRWSQWPIDLTGIDLSNVPTLAVGFERTGAIGGAGVVYLDEIHLDRSASEIVAANPVLNGDFEY